MDEMDQNEELFRAWIGEKNQEKYWQRMKNGGFSWGAFFIPNLLMLTRKMSFEPIMLVILSFLIDSVYVILNVPTGVAIVTNLAIKIILGFTYYYIYRWSISRKIKYYQSQGYTYEKQLELAKKRGGDKVTVSVLLAFIIVVALYLFFKNVMGAPFNVFF